MRQRGVAGENKIVMVGVLKKAANTLPIGSSVKIIYYSDWLPCTLMWKNIVAK